MRTQGCMKLHVLFYRCRGEKSSHHLNKKESIYL